MREQLIALIATIVSGVLVFIFSQLFVEFILRPIQEYKKLKAKTSKMLIYHAQYYSNPQNAMEANKFPAWKDASSQIRELSAEVAAFAEIKPLQIFVFYSIPTKKKLLEASSYLMGLSNSFFLSSSEMEICIERSNTYPKIIRKCMRIS